MKFQPRETHIERQEPQRYNTIVKANSLIQKSRFSLSTQQQKILLFIISQIEPSDTDLKLYEFTITDFCRICGIEPKGDMYNLLKKQIQEISNKSMWIETDESKETLVRWIEKPYIDKNSGTIQIKLDEDMKPFLLQLKERFTEYELIYTLNFKSKYSIRLYEYLKSIHFRKLHPYTQTISIEKFQRLLDSDYKNFKDFHTRVLKPACKEINEFSDIKVSYILITKGRKTTDIQITIEAKQGIEPLLQAYKNDEMLNERITKK